jgi:hypothetical protein
MSIRRTSVPQRDATAYERLVRDVLDSPGKRPVDSLAVLWAHQIAYAAHGAPLDELEQLASTAQRYDVPLQNVLNERHQQPPPSTLAPARRKQPPTANANPPASDTDTARSPAPDAAATRGPRAASRPPRFLPK